MLIAKINQDNSITVQEYQEMFPLATFPMAGPNDSFMEDNNCKHVTLFKAHTALEKLVPCTPYLDNNIVYLVEVVAKTQEELDQELAVQNLKNATRIAENIEKLWQAAHDYEYKYINGMGIGLLTLGVLQNKPKALAIAEWVNTIWNTYYYPRKASMTAEYLPELYDFSVAGPMPYTVPELTVEVYG